MSSIVASGKGFLKKALPEPIVEMIRDAKYSKPNIAEHKWYTKLLEGKDGIEIGGPTWRFRYEIPLYKSIASLDGVNFATKTIWEGDLSTKSGYNYFRGKSGRQFISEATDLSEIEDGKYDFLISSNCLEHIANPIKALRAWKRLVKSGGYIIVLVPDKLHIFDHRRDTTTFEHLIEDYNADRDEHDRTHVEEALAKHDLSMDPRAGDFENLKRRFADNFHNRSLHHHVFDLPLLGSMFEFINLKVIKSEALPPDLAIVGEVAK